MTKERVYWTDDERQRLAEIVIGMHKKNPQETLNSQLNRAQQQIPTHRRRKIFAVNQLDWLVEAWRKHVEELDKGFRIIAQEIPPQKTVEEFLTETTTEQLAVALIRRLMHNTEILQQSAKLLFNAAGKFGAGVAVPTPIVAKRPKAVVVGVKNNQTNEIKSRFDASVDLRFIDSGGSSALPSPFPLGEIFILTGFVDHSAYYALRDIAKNRGSKCRECSGGVSNVCNEIEKWLKGT
ncbi:MAG: hypothetical protein Q8K86_07070 [Candidatus Nanopelagicaceae bacterium]|nr:hypothetical protein [Candidatus Nanopelagicaceae bacterium]